MRRRIWAVVLGACLGLLASYVVLNSRGRAVGSGSARLISAPLLPESSGALTTVAMHYVSQLESLVEAPYTDFLRATASDLRVVFLVGEGGSERRRLQAFLERIDPSGGLLQRSQIVETPGPISTWSKDRALVTSAGARGQPARLIAPSEPLPDWIERHNDWRTIPTLARASQGQFEASVAPLDFDAGDFVIDEQRVVFDSNLLEKNRHRGIEDAAALRRRVSLWLRMPVLMLGEEVGDTPRHHLAMYMTPLDPNMMLVGDPRLARNIVGDSYLPGDRSGDNGEPLVPDFSDETAARFDRAAGDLAAAGYRVERIPVLAFDDKTYVSYTNGVFESRAGAKIAYMPEYGIAGLDQAARAVYQRSGWQVRPIRVRALYPYHGTIGCLVNVLTRS